MAIKISLFKSKSYTCHHSEDSLTSTGIMVSILYVRVKGVSSVVIFGMQRYPYKTSTNSFVRRYAFYFIIAFVLSF